MQNKRQQLGVLAILVLVTCVVLILWLVGGAIIRGRIVSGPAVVPAAQNQEIIQKNAAVVSVEQVVLEETVGVFLANFYAAYADADAERIATYFTVDSKPEDRARYQALFLGAPEEKLFIAPNAQERVSGHEVISAESEGPIWKLTINEQRNTIQGDDIPLTTTVMKLIPAPAGAGTWLIASYARQGATGTYEALLSR